MIALGDRSLDSVLRELGYLPADGQRWVNGIAKDGVLVFAPGISDAYEKTVVWLHGAGLIECADLIESYRSERPWLFESAAA